MKKLFLILYIIALVLAFAIVPFGLYAVSLPLWTAVIFMALPVVTAFYKGKTKWVIIRAVGGVIMAAVCFAGTFCNPYWGSFMFRAKTDSFRKDLTYEQACADLDEIVSVLKRVHPRFLDEPDVLSAAHDNAKNRAAVGVAVGGLCYIAQKMVSELGDAHTTVYAMHSDDRYRADYAELATDGYEVTAINGVPIDEFFRTNSFLFSFEAESWGMYQLKNKLYSADGLRYMGLSTEGLSLTFSDGENELTRSYTDADFVPYDEYMEQNKKYYENRNEKFVSYEIDEEKSLALFTLKECVYNDEYKNTLRDMFVKVKEQGIANVAVDVRGNGGGSSLVVNEFIRYLDVESYLEPGEKWRLGMFMTDSPSRRTVNDKADITFTGNVYLLCDASSFSSAMLFAEYIKDNSLGTLIGEAPGNAASSYGDITIFRLPNSGLYLQCSTKIFTRPDISNPDLFVEPDIPCRSSDAMNVLYSLLEQ